MIGSYLSGQETVSYYVANYRYINKTRQAWALNTWGRKTASALKGLIEFDVFFQSFFIQGSFNLKCLLEI